MPYSGPDDDKLPDHVQKMPQGDREQWVAVWNETFDACMSDDGEESDCEGQAFAAANGAVEENERMPNEKRPEGTRLRRIWNRLLDYLLATEPEQLVPEEVAEQERAISMYRIEEQIWSLLNPDDMMADEWAWPLDIFVDDDNSLFVIVSQAGKLYRVALLVDGEEVSLGDWTQVTQVFEPVQQTARFLVRRTADGSHRWLMVAATAVLNRVGEIDSTALFDSFVARAEETGQYPRLDFYHMGGSDPDLWEFGTADYLARDGVCYIASGTFDEDHPLAKATIRAVQREPGKWGASIEFMAIGERTLVAVEPEVTIPVYTEGENTRISVVLERDAAGWFTNTGAREVKRQMEGYIREKLVELFGDENAEEIEEFETRVDGVNRTVKDERLVYRSQAVGEEGGDNAQPEGDANEAAPQAEDAPAFELDDEAVSAIARAMLATDAFRTMDEVVRSQVDAINALDETTKTLAEQVTALTEENEKLQERIGKLVSRVKLLERGDAEKQAEWQQDLPASAATRVTYRPRFRNADEESDEDAVDMGAIAAETHRKLDVPAY